MSEKCTFNVVADRRMRNIKKRNYIYYMFTISIHERKRKQFKNMSISVTTKHSCLFTPMLDYTRR